ncbi:hypothetical protein F5X99DRAFT_217780 [Biscogniauxia marginata]|nr:hypothetical protein F5X99DRAFT_217780 [Biscogniauxia marginata]
MDLNQDLREGIKGRIPGITLQERPTRSNEHKNIYHEDQDRLLSFPAVRDLEWNPDFKGKKAIEKYPDNLAAAITYVVGVEAENPCRKCQNKSGPFKGCILPPPGSQVKKYSCANCRYNWQSKQCHHCPDYKGSGNKNVAAQPVSRPATRAQEAHDAKDGEESDSLFVEEDEGYLRFKEEFGV